MNLRCYVIDDELYAADMVAALIKQTAGLELIGIETDDEAALAKLLSKEIVADIVFLDIELRNINGVAFALQVQEFTHVVFVTGEEKYALEAFEHGITDYLLKPVVYSRFLKSIERVRTALNIKGLERKADDQLKIGIRCDRKLIFIKAADIIYIESASNYLKFHLSNNKMYITYMSFSMLEDQLRHSSLMRVHRSHMVNMDLVKSLDGNMIELANEVKILLGTNYKEAFLKKLNVKP